jgi:hypothetical protein
MSIHLLNYWELKKNTYERQQEEESILRYTNTHHNISNNNKKLLMENNNERKQAILLQATQDLYDAKWQCDMWTKPWWEWQAESDNNRWWEDPDNYDFRKNEWKVTPNVERMYQLNLIDGWENQQLEYAAKERYKYFLNQKVRSYFKFNGSLVTENESPYWEQECQLVVSMRRWLFTGNCAGTGDHGRLPQMDVYPSVRYPQFKRGRGRKENATTSLDNEEHVFN